MSDNPFLIMSNEEAYYAYASLESNIVIGIKKSNNEVFGQMYFPQSNDYLTENIYQWSLPIEEKTKIWRLTKDDINKYSSGFPIGDFFQFNPQEVLPLSYITVTDKSYILINQKKLDNEINFDGRVWSSSGQPIAPEDLVPNLNLQYKLTFSGDMSNLPEIEDEDIIEIHYTYLNVKPLENNTYYDIVVYYNGSLNFSDISYVLDDYVAIGDADLYEAEFNPVIDTTDIKEEVIAYYNNWWSGVSNIDEESYIVYEEGITHNYDLKFYKYEDDNFILLDTVNTVSVPIEETEIPITARQSITITSQIGKPQEEWDSESDGWKYWGFSGSLYSDSPLTLVRIFDVPSNLKEQINWPTESEQTSTSDEDWVNLYLSFSIPESTEIKELEGAALLNFGNIDANDEAGNNYGVAINSSDDYLNLPARAISLFKSKIDPNASIKVSYDYQGILGTLPDSANIKDKTADIYAQYMAGTQGIYTDNMYIGDKDQFIAFYDIGNGKKNLRISAKEIFYEIKYSNVYTQFVDEDPENPYVVTEDDTTIYYYFDETDNEYKEVDSPIGKSPSGEGWFIVTGTTEDLTSWEEHLESNRLQYFWQNLQRQEADGDKPAYPAGSYMASGNKRKFDASDSRTYGYNSFLDNSSFNIRYNNIDLIRLGREIELNNIISNNEEIIGSEPSIKISSSDGLQIFKKIGEGSNVDYPAVIKMNKKATVFGIENIENSNGFIKFSNDGEINISNVLYISSSGIRLAETAEFKIGNNDTFLRFFKNSNTNEYGLELKTSYFNLSSGTIQNTKEENAEQQINVSILQPLENATDKLAKQNENIEARLRSIENNDYDQTAKLILDYGGEDKNPFIIVGAGGVTKNYVEILEDKISIKQGSRLDDARDINKTTITPTEITTERVNIGKDENGTDVGYYWQYRQSGHLSLRIR